jgi:hypothetical protein
MCTYVVIEYERGVLCGGLGDRIVGLCSAILLARSLKKHLLIKWDSPSIEGVFDLSIYNFYNVNPSIENAVVLHTIDDRFKFEKQLSEHPVHAEWNQKNVWLRSNQELAYFLYQNPHLLKGHNYNEDMIRTYRSIFSVYLKPVNMFVKNISEPYIGIQVRTGDAYMNVGSHKPIENIPLVVENVSRYIKNCTLRLKTIYVTSDHPDVTQLFKNELPSYNIVDMPDSKSHLERSNIDTYKFKSIVSDLLTLSRANFLIISSKSNYGRIAALTSTTSPTIEGFEPPSFNVHPLDVNTLFTNCTR